MMASNYPRKGLALTSSKAIANAASWYCAFVLVALALLSMFKDSSMLIPSQYASGQLLSRPCEEIYVVGEGETLHTISDKCGDPFIVENNPHIHDPDDVFPGLVIKITPSLRT
ncbi:hypothetical protein AAZX31_07G075800 [Glycine max]|uniref:LysM domain-containing protein n=2 Tax=Glycine subgen. Soja TaxID=1462606 RepID=I1KII7_SOYBN|nr:uncharacterized protein LOC100815990 [Glycine max]XP_028242365.1 uncharacterized protein LOC114420761 [Glycine soja]KAG5009275.1 hypothetical protein JHK87_017790 [Glycine soja]KAG5037070.1 hypothetical protein JHK86_017910 [Glycine max]KAH1085905.1 hypothetical protein GYH30_017734 [Glycine max]KHN04607.1 hypothetical protein glysoja_021906 [Glycine soja]KRH48280.1 hypothetical protein GLYMA_07G079600v4 [Glycine max]|eukprot:XP_003528887.1 uncharacterized protein LOC100815990 [Glycine max]